MQETCEIWVQSLGQEDPLEEGMATHSSLLAWKIPWTEEPGRLQSLGSLGVWKAAVHGVAEGCIRLSVSTFPFSLSCIGEGNGNPLQSSCLENPVDRGAWQGCCLWGHTESDTTEAT